MVAKRTATKERMLARGASEEKTKKLKNAWTFFEG